MVRYYHLILSAYGFWLPNDPRGSWSDFVSSWELYKFGPAMKVNEKRSFAHDPHDATRRRAAKQSLKYPPVRFNAIQREAIGKGFARAVTEANYVVHACCIGHDHAHLLIARHERPIEKIAGHLKSMASSSMRLAGCHPLAAFAGDDKFPTPWSMGCWNVWIDDERHAQSAVKYIARHPWKEGLDLQRWEFVLTPHEITGA